MDSNVSWLKGWERWKKTLFFAITAFWGGNKRDECAERRCDEMEGVTNMVMDVSFGVVVTVEKMISVGIYFFTT